MARSCPDLPELKAFSVGDLSRSRLEKVAQHITECSRCAQSIESVERESDEFVDQLSQLDSSDISSETTVPPELIEAVQSARGSSRSSEISIDPGRRYSKTLAQGPCHIGRFELQEELGAGSFGYVFRAWDPELQRTVAVKIQRGGGIGDEADVQRFMREARSAASLRHPNIVALYETGCTEEGVCFLVTEFIDGQTLGSLLSDQRQDFNTSAQQVATLADALHEAHRKGIIHRDVKPSNILIDSSGSPHLMDFGLAKREADVTMTSEGHLLGTPAYMSPEQASGDVHEIDPRTDIYSLGVVLYEMLSCERPFRGDRRMLLLQIMEDQPPRLRGLDDTIPSDLETICAKAMAKQPRRRYQSAEELAKDLRRFLNGEPIEARPVGKVERLWRWSRKNPVAVSMLVAVSFASLVGILYLSALSRYLVQQTSLESAKQQAEMLEEMNSFYSELVQRIRPHGIEITHDYLSKEGTMPLPATFTIDAGERISRSASGMQVRLYSDYPFPWRPDGGPRDQFDHHALESLRLNPDQPVHEFSEKEGVPVLRYAVARRMKQSCLDCHNGHEQSPKRDWQEGDVRGVLQIVRPLEHDIERTRAGLRSGLGLIAVVALVLVGLSLAFLFASRRRSPTPR